MVPPKQKTLRVITPQGLSVVLPRHLRNESPSQRARAKSVFDDVRRQPHALMSSAVVLSVPRSYFNVTVLTRQRSMSCQTTPG